MRLKNVVLESKAGPVASIHDELTIRSLDIKDSRTIGCGGYREEDLRMN